MDHNQLSEAQTGLLAAVRKVVDHHDRDESLPAAVHSVIEPVGSCATLVAQQRASRDRATGEPAATCGRRGTAPASHCVPAPPFDAVLSSSSS